MKVGSVDCMPPICSNGYWWSAKRKADSPDSTWYSNRSHDSFASGVNAS